MRKKVRLYIQHLSYLIKQHCLNRYISKWLDRANSFNNGFRQPVSGLSVYFITDFTQDLCKNNLSTLHSREMWRIFLHSTVFWSFKLRLELLHRESQKETNRLQIIVFTWIPSERDSMKYFFTFLFVYFSNYFIKVLW